MEFKTTSSIKRRHAFTLAELMVSIGVSTLVICAIAAVSLYAARSFALLNNYSDLSALSALALDQITRDVRQAEALTTLSTNQIALQMGSNVPPVTFTYDPQARTLTRQSGSNATVLLTGCNSLAFSAYQRTPIQGTYDQYPPASVANSKVVSVNWVCSREIVNLLSTENAQSAKIVLRRH
jgi:Tfp pilus assembly protein PilW